MTGILVGGVWGLAEGLGNPDGRTWRLRLNSVLNGCTRRGPFLANSLGVVALMYGCTNTALEKSTGLEDDLRLSGAAAVATGVLFKCTKGGRAAAIGGAVGAAAAGLYHAGDNFLNSRGQTWGQTSQSNWS